MHELQNSGVHTAAPYTVTYNTFIGAYARVSKIVNKDASLKAERVLGDTIHLRNNINPLIAPEHRSYNQLISAWVNTKQLNSSEKSYWWWCRMREEYNETWNERIRPNVHTYNTVTVAFAWLGYAVKVENLLLEVLDQEGSNDMKLPNKGEA